MANGIQALHEPTKLGVSSDYSALRLRLGEVTIEHRPVVAELREAMRKRLEDAECPNPRRRGLWRAEGREA